MAHPTVRYGREPLRLIAPALLFGASIFGALIAPAQARSPLNPPLDCRHFDPGVGRQACENANGGETQAQVLTGRAYATGDGVPVDYTIALRLFRLAADQSDPGGEAYLGALYSSGRGVARNDAEAIRLFRLAADKGNPIAEVDLADLYVNGRGVAKDNAEAIRLYRLAADRGNADGMNGLAWRLAVDGQNLDEALDWATRAAAAKPQNGAAEDTLAWILYRQDKALAALPHALRAAGMEPHCASCEDHLGDIYAVLAGDRIYAAPDDAAAARIHWRRALDLSVGQPSDPDWDRAAVKRKLSAP